MHELHTIDDLKPADYNPREITDEALQGLSHSLDVFGDISGIVWNRRTGHLVCGHQRLKALRDRWHDDLMVVPVDGTGDYEITAPADAEDNSYPVRVVEWDEPFEKAANVAANSPHLAGEFTPDVVDLIQEIKIELPELSDHLFLQDLSDSFPSEQELGEGLTEPDAVPEPAPEPVARTGDVWSLGTHRILCDDATSPGAIVALLHGAEVGAIVTDPPYGIDLDTDYSSMKNKLEFAQEKGITAGRKYEPVTGDSQPFNPEPVIALLHDPPQQLWFGADYYASRLADTERSGAWLVWDKRLTESADRMYGSCFELIWSKHKCKREILRHKWAGIFGTESEPQRGRQHPTQKPVVLMVDLVGRTDGLVADPYAGSGSTIIACEQLGRQCYAMEIDPRYVSVAVRRWQDFTGEEAILEGDGHTFAEVARERYDG